MVELFSILGTGQGGGDLGRKEFFSLLGAGQGGGDLGRVLREVIRKRVDIEILIISFFVLNCNLFLSVTTRKWVTTCIISPPHPPRKWL